MKKSFIFGILAVSLATALSGCATSLVLHNCTWNEGCSSKVYKEYLADDYIAIGRPAKLIAGYDRPLILAGKKSSVMITLPDDEKDLFEKVLKQQYLLKHLNVSLTSGNGNPNRFFIQEQDKKAQNITGHAGLYFVKPVDLFTEQERIALEKLGFERGENYDVKSCFDDGYGQGGCGVERVYYRKGFTITMSLAGTVNNLNQLTHQLKKPMHLEFDHQRESKLAPISQALVLPAVAVDIVTLPIQAVVWTLGGYKVF